jgi:RNA polymerase sigma-70 factor (ECF subfamily)
VLAVGVGAGAALAPRDPSGPAAASSAAAPGTRVGTVEEGGVRLTASVVPAAGWVRIRATVAGIPAGEDCRLYLVARDGRREVAGGWRVSPSGERDGVTLDGSASMSPGDVTAVEVRNTAGQTYALLPL